MNLKWIGAAMTIISCGGCGFLAANAHKRQESSLHQLSQILSYMTWELEYRLTPLPELCRKAALQTKSSLGRFFNLLAQELEGQAAPDVNSCLMVALSKIHDIPKLTVTGLELLGKSLGQFDLTGQLKGLEAVGEYCRNELQKLSFHREERLRSYRVLGICAGATLAILFV